MAYRLGLLLTQGWATDEFIFVEFHANVYEKHLVRSDNPWYESM